MSTPQAITPEGVAKHIHALLQTNVNAKKLPNQELKGNRVYATINDEAGALVCTLVADVGAAGSTGAALSKIPPGAVQDLVRKGEPLDEDLLANYHEIANVLTVLTTAAVGRRTILRNVEQAKGDPPAPLRDLIKNAKNKLFLQVTV
ncbi:MAG: hypothetical protein ABW352_05105, partial [Polyangiales bacterium]